MRQLIGTGLYYLKNANETSLEEFWYSTNIGAYDIIFWKQRVTEFEGILSKNNPVLWIAYVLLAYIYFCNDETDGDINHFEKIIGWFISIKVLFKGMREKLLSVFHFYYGRF